MSREMKSSDIEWVNSIPNEWHETKLSRVSARITDFVASGSFADLNENVKYLDRPDYAMLVRTADLSGTRSNTVYINKHAYNFLSNSNLHGGEIILSNIGSVGSVFMYEPMYERASLAPNAIMVDKTPCNRYYYYYFQCTGAGAELRTIGGSSVQTKFNKTQLRALKVVVPPLSEQHQIVSFLDRKCSAIDTAIEKTKKSIEKLEEYKKAVITKAVTKGLDPDAKMKDSGIEWIGEVPETWDVKRVKHVSTSISKGNGITKDDVVEDGDISCVRYGEIYSQYSLGFDKCVTKTNLSKVSSPQYFSYGDIICAGTGELIEEIGKPIVYLGSELCLAGGDIVVIKHKQNPLYLEYALESACSQGQRSIGKYKLKVVHISASDIGNIRIALPNIEEQNRIVEYLDNKIQSISNVIESKLSTIEKLEEYKKSLIYYAVTGKIDCRGEMV